MVASPGAIGGDPSWFYYIKGIGFDESEFAVGVNETDLPDAVSIFPNPSEGSFTLSLQNTGTLDVRVADMFGARVITPAA